MKGMFSSSKFMFLEIKVTPCVTPNDPNQSWNPICAPAAEVFIYYEKELNIFSIHYLFLKNLGLFFSSSQVASITQRDGYHGMNIYHSNYVLNPDSPNTPFTPYINDKLFFTFVPDSMTTLCDIYF